MTNEFKLYLLTRLDSIQGVSIAIMVVSILGFIFYVIAYASTKADDYSDGRDTKLFIESYRWIKKTTAWLAIIFTSIVVFVPSRNEAILIYAGGKTMDFMQADTSINKIPAKSTEFIIKYLDEKVKELDKEDKK